VVLILRAAVKHKMRIRISPFFHELMDQDASRVLLTYLRDRSSYRARFREIFAPDHKPCSIPKKDMRVNSNGEISACCFMDDAGHPLGNILKKGLPEAVVSDRYWKFVNNAVQGEGNCCHCKEGFNANYGVRSHA